MTDLDKMPVFKVDKPIAEPAELVKPTKEVTVLPAKVKPVQVAPTHKEKEVTTMTDPEGIFDYSGCQIHVVQAGETLLSIAQEYVVAFQQLRYFNHLDHQNPKIRTGQKLAIPKEPVQVPYAK